MQEIQSPNRLQALDSRAVVAVLQTSYQLLRTNSDPRQHLLSITKSPLLTLTMLINHQMKLFRNQKPSKQTPSSSNTSRSPPLSADGPSLRDLSSRIEPYTLGSPSPPPSSATPIHSALHSHRQGHQQHGGTNSGISSSGIMPSGDPDLSRRHSMRARPSQEDPWVVVNTSTTPNQDPVDSRSSSIASLMQPSLGATGATAPYISTHFIHQQHQQRDGSNSNIGSGNASNPTISSPSPSLPPQSRTAPAKQRPPPTSTTPQPNSQQQIQQQQQQQQQPPQPPPHAQSPPKMNGQQPYPDDGLYVNGNIYASKSIGQAQEEGSIHSQQEKSWTRVLFGSANTRREKEANAELLRMIGATTASGFPMGIY